MKKQTLSDENKFRKCFSIFGEYLPKDNKEVDDSLDFICSYYGKLIKKLEKLKDDSKRYNELKNILIGDLK